MRERIAPRQLIGLIRLIDPARPMSSALWLAPGPLAPSAPSPRTGVPGRRAAPDGRLDIIRSAGSTVDSKGCGSWRRPDESALGSGPTAIRPATSVVASAGRSHTRPVIVTTLPLQMAATLAAVWLPGAGLEQQVASKQLVSVSPCCLPSSPTRLLLRFQPQLLRLEPPTGSARRARPRPPLRGARFVSAK